MLNPPTNKHSRGDHCLLYLDIYATILWCVYNTILYIFILLIYLFYIFIYRYTIRFMFYTFSFDFVWAFFTQRIKFNGITISLSPIVLQGQYKHINKYILNCSYQTIGFNIALRRPWHFFFKILWWNITYIRSIQNINITKITFYVK